MSKIALSGPAGGTATYTVTAPTGATDRTLTLPDSSGTIATSESTLVQFNASGSAPVYACRAWVNFDGTGTPAIRGSGNVSSITDNGVGDYRVNFTTAMSDTNYSTLVTSDSSGNYYVGAMNGSGYTAAYAGVRTLNASGSLADSPVVNVAVFR